MPVLFIYRKKFFFKSGFSSVAVLLRSKVIRRKVRHIVIIIYLNVYQSHNCNLFF